MEKESSTEENGESNSTSTLKQKKYISLVILLLHNAIHGLSMRYSRARSVDMFFEGTAVLMAEVVKLIVCLYLVYISPDEGAGHLKTLLGVLHKTIILNKVDTLKVCVPAFIYLIQNNLQYVAAEHLDVGTYQITYQLKILTTAIFSVLLLKRSITKIQWMSLLLLVLGVALVQLSDSKETIVIDQGEARYQNRLLGFIAVLSACALSGLAGVYFEKILKGSSDVSVWMRNVQLSLAAIPLGVIVSFLKHFEGIQEKGFFFGYDLFVIYIILSNALGGILVAVVIKYADNILKVFATSLSIIVTCIASMFLFGFLISLQFIMGAAIVIGATFIYGYEPKLSTLELAAPDDLINKYDVEKQEKNIDDTELDSQKGLLNNEIKDALSIPILHNQTNKL